MVKGTQPCCGECGCSLSLKLRSMDSECPHPDGPKWGAEVLPNQSSNHGSNIQSGESQLRKFRS